MSYTIYAEGLRKALGKQLILSNLNLQVSANTIFALLGPNGSGKTTTVRILSTLLKPDAGLVEIAGHNLLTAPEKVRACISLTGQYAAVDELLTGRENLAMLAKLRRMNSQESRKKIAELLEKLDLTSAADRRVATYSGGMRRKLDLAISLLTPTPVLFLDEPTTGLDPHSRRALWEIISELPQTGTTVFLTTQYLEEADRLADRIAVIGQGAVITEGTAEELKKQVGGETVEVFFNTQEDMQKASRVLLGHPISEKLSVKVTSNGSATEVHQLLSALQQHQIEAQHLALHRPTLDDVFFALTGPSTFNSLARKQ